MCYKFCTLLLKNLGKGEEKSGCMHFDEWRVDSHRVALEFLARRFENQQLHDIEPLD